MPNVWVATADQKTLLRADRITEVSESETTLTVRTADASILTFEIIADWQNAQPAAAGVRARELAGMLSLAHIWVNNQNKPHVVAAAVEDGVTRWTVEPLNVDSDSIGTLYPLR